MITNDAKPDRALTAGRSYYVGQLGGWGLYALLTYLLSPPPRGLGFALMSVVLAAIALLCTHALAVYANRWHSRSTSQLILPFALAALTISFIMNAVRVATSIALFGNAIDISHPWVFIAHYFQGVLVASVWCALYATAIEGRRRRLAETEALRLALVAQVAQFQSLQSQLNPHFLFNCLNSLRELIDEDSDRAKQVIDLLSHLLRYTLRAGRIEVVSLREELDAVKDYLALEKVRFEERLQISFDVADETLDAKIPPMILQTLAENGVKHGIVRLPDGGKLTIGAHRTAAQLEIEVTNSGALSETAHESPSIGLENARERLRLMYGESASLTLDSTHPQTVTATLLIPFSVNGRKP